ncbi:MAG: NUDIX domain-containing protein [Acidobacteria bacterium]|nr:MAG: NUDIX domain-containing protein [Acidobacteriota bacterium]
MSSTFEKPPEFRYCPKCGNELVIKRLKHHEPERMVCKACDFIFFQDPKVAAGTVFESDGGLVLLRRAIEPAYGKWVFPGGFVDRGERVPDAAIRETREEASVDVTIRELIDVYSYAGSPIVVIVYAAEICGGELRAADETLEAKVFEPSAIPWDELAFRSTTEAVTAYIERFL